MKRVGINATLLSPTAGGVGEYMKQLVTGFQRWPLDQQPCVFINKQVRREYGFDGIANMLEIPTLKSTPVLRIPYEFIQWRAVLSQHKIRLFHSPISYIPPGVNIPAIVTIHDLRYFHFPETYTWLRGKFLQSSIPRSLQKAVKIIAVSEYTKSDIVRLFNIPPDKVVVIYEGLDFRRFGAAISPQDIVRVRQQYDLPEQYVLAVGHLEPRKNYLRLFEAFRILLDQHNQALKLVVVGQENWFYEKIYQQASRLGLDEFVRFTGFVADADLPCIYHMAGLFVAPSIFEGFGFTPLEAMAAGVPVLASNATSHPEVCGKAALYFNPADPENIAEKMQLGWNDNTLRQKLTALGKENIKRFSWKNCCNQTMDVYQKTLNQL